MLLRSIDACFRLWGGENHTLSKIEIVKSLVPFLFGRYWYITCYIPLAILKPFVNKMLLALSKIQHKKLCIISIAIFAVIPAIFDQDFFYLNKGYSFAWLMICYTIGAYLKRTEDTRRNKKINKINIFMIFICMSIVLLMIKAVYDRVFNIDGTYFIEYISPVVLLMAVIILLSTEQLKVKNGKILSKMSTVSFDVYIIHCHILVFDKIIYNQFEWIGEMPFFLIPIIILCLAIFIYLLLGIIGIGRSTMFDKLCINRILKKMALTVDNIVYGDLICK